MEQCKIIETLPSAEEYNRLRQAVGWGTYQESVIWYALPQSLYCVCAFVDERLVGMARLIGDAGLVYYIQDVIVIPGYQRCGIGSQLMDHVMAYIRDHAGDHTIIGLMSAQGKESFYEKYGFTSRPTEQLGAGMTLFWRAK